MILALAAVTAEDSRIRRDKHHPRHEKARRDDAMLEAVLKTLALG
jgi:hypothetical protein